MRKRKDQIFETGEGFIQLKEVLPDKHRKKPQWKLTLIQPIEESKKSASSASIASSSHTYMENKKIIPKICRGNEEINIYSHIERAAEQDAQDALDAKEERCVSECELEEREAIQNEGRIGKKCQDRD
jgi:hypothetical protein